MSVFTREKRSAAASSTKSACTAWVPCHTLVTINGSAVISTTKIGVIGESPNHTMAKIAQIADDTVLSTGSTGSKKLPIARLEPSRMPAGTPIATAIRNPATTRPNVVMRLTGRSPVPVSCTTRANTRSGPGST